MASDAERNAALYRQRMMSTNPQLSMASPPPPRQTNFNPNLAVPPHMPPAVARPPPPGAPRSVKKLTGSSRKVPPRMDPTNTYTNIKDKEKQTGDDDGEGTGMLSGINRLMVGIIAALAVSTIFVLPRQLKVFWIIILGLTFLIHLGFLIYKEWMYMGKNGGEDAKYAQWASFLLYGMAMVYTAVMVGILFFMSWSLYSIANSRTNLARLDRAAMEDREDMQQQRVYV